MMKRVLMAAAAIAFAASTGGLVSQSVAATAKDPYCNMAKSQRNPVSWNAHYHCVKAAPTAMRAAPRAKVRQAKGLSRDPYCAYAGTQKNQVAWNAYYRCLKH